MRSYHGFLTGAAITIGGLVATMVLHGGWRAVAGAVAILGVMVVVPCFLALAVASDRPRPERPDWAQGGRRTALPRQRRQADLSASASKSARSTTVVDANMTPAARPSA
jgi:MFS family permease